MGTARAKSTEHSQRVHEVMDFVRAHPTADLSLEVLARQAGLSTYHFHRVFRSVAGETAAAFVRRSRLEHAAYLMKASPERQLSSIALDLGYPTLSEFSRAFRREYGIAPSEWDRKSRIDGRIGCDWDSEPPHRIEPRLVEHEPCRLAYVRMKCWFTGEELPRGFAKLTAWLESRGVDWRREQMLGLCWDHYETTPLEQVRYDFAFAVPRRVEAGDGIGIHELPAHRAVEVHCSGPLSEIGRAWDYLYNEWFPASEFEPAGLPAIKRFRRRPDELDWTSWDLDCSIAIRRALP